MTTRDQQARIYNEAVAQGLSEDAALRAAGITNANDFNFGTNGQLEPTRVGPPRRANETIVPANVSIDADDDERQFVTRPVSSQTTTTNQNTATGGSVRTTTVTPTTYQDTAQSSALKTQADSLTAQKETRAAELRAQGKTGAEILRDPQYKTLSQEAQAKEYAAQDARAVNQSGTVATTTTPGSGQVFQQTPNSSFLTQDTAGDDPTVNAQDANRFSTSGELPRNVSAGSTRADPQANQGFVFDENGDLVPADSAEAQRIQQQQAVEFTDDYASSGDFASLEAAQAAEAEAFARGDTPQPVTGDPQVDPDGPAFDDDGNLNPGFTLDGDGNPVFIGNDFIDPGLEASAAASRQQATLDNARKQATIQSQRKQGNDTDWRVRLSLAPQANYLYMAPDVAGQPGSGILAPLRRTNGVIFPYTPRISTAYVARYNNYDLTHSNYRGYFYSGSHIEDINIEATFTAQDTAEAEYLLAVIHFFRAVTKMFYGQDAQRGTPPPLVYLRGLGEFQYNLHPCVVSQFNYNLPSDVDYIRARSKNTASGSLLQRRERESVPTNIFSSALQRLSAAGLSKGAQPAPPPVPSLGIVDASYVPTKLDLQIVLKPMQSREQVSRQFSLQQYANGDLLKGGFW
jgi:hypothetical protein